MINIRGNLIVKKIESSGVIPTVPISTDITERLSTDIDSGELAINVPDDKLFFRGNTIREVSVKNPPTYVEDNSEFTVVGGHGVLLYNGSTDCFFILPEFDSSEASYNMNGFTVNIVRVNTGIVSIVVNNSAYTISGDDRLDLIEQWDSVVIMWSHDLQQYVRIS